MPSAPPPPSPPPGDDFRPLLPALVCVTAVFLLNFMIRIALAPLAVPIEADLGLSHAGTGRLFFVLGAGTSLAYLLSGFVSQALGHRRTIVTSALALGVTVLAAAASRSHGQLAAALFAVGFAAGLYLPSGIATVTAIAPPRHWGKALGVHEAAPNVSFIVAPLVAEAVLHVAPWRAVLAVLGVGSLVAGLVYARFGSGGHARGQAPRPAVAADILRRPAFWVLLVFFCAAVGGSVGPYSMLPLYLVDEQGYGRETANLLLSVSRVSGLFMAFAAGLLTDRLGANRTIVLSLAATGVWTVALGLATGGFLVAAALAQPVFSVCFFPAGFTALAKVFPSETRHVAVSLLSPAAALLGSGAVPAALGWAGQQGSFAAGFVVLGVGLLACLLLLPRLVREEHG